MRTIKYIVVHCTATPPETKIENIEHYWKEKLGWKNPGYHYIIERNGDIVNLIPEQKPSNGVKGFNQVSIHISYIGGIDKDCRPVDNRTNAQKHAMFNKLIDLAEKYPQAIILGHRDLSPDKNNDGIIEPAEWVKHCPSFDVKEWLRDYTPF
jgi:N-acetyl-anhydromuramyl-L-alanine amidase AmpD